MLSFDELSSLLIDQGVSLKMYPLPGKVVTCCIALVGVCKNYNDGKGIRQPIAECSNFDPKIALISVVDKAVKDGWLILPGVICEQQKIEGESADRAEAESFN